MNIEFSNVSNTKNLPQLNNGNKTKINNIKFFILTYIYKLILNSINVCMKLPSQLIVILIITFCAMYASCAFGLIIVIYLHTEFAASDIEAGIYNYIIMYNI